MRELKFKENLRFFRIRAKIKQRELAEIVNVDQRTVSAWETGVCQPSLEIISQLCEIFDETADSLLFDDYN